MTSPNQDPRSRVHVGKRLDVGPGPGETLRVVDPDTVRDIVPSSVVASCRYVLRFDFPWDAGEPRYATLHPDPPHDWALTGTNELARAASFTDYAVAARVLDFDYGRRRRDDQAQGRHGRVVILAEEVHDLSELAARAMAELRDRSVG